MGVTMSAGGAAQDMCDSDSAATTSDVTGVGCGRKQPHGEHGVEPSEDEDVDGEEDVRSSPKRKEREDDVRFSKKRKGRKEREDDVPCSPNTKRRKEVQSMLANLMETRMQMILDSDDEDVIRDAKRELDQLKAFEAKLTEQWVCANRTSTDNNVGIVASVMSSEVALNILRSGLIGAILAFMVGLPQASVITTYTLLSQGGKRCLFPLLEGDVDKLLNGISELPKECGGEALKAGLCHLVSRTMFGAVGGALTGAALTYAVPELKEVVIQWATTHLLSRGKEMANVF